MKSCVYHPMWLAQHLWQPVCDACGFIVLAIFVNEYGVYVFACLIFVACGNGATKIGSSAPELGTVIIGVFFAKDDIGVSGVIGSAVFNIMFVISVCALFSGTVCHLNWWPLVRDCFFYSLSIIVMLIIMLNDYISWVRIVAWATISLFILPNTERFLPNFFSPYFTSFLLPIL